MTQEDKELLIKDICARLDTNLVCSIYRTDDEGVGYRDEILHGYCKGDIWYEFYFREDCSIGIDNVSKIKPYLFPLSSMTEEMIEEFNNLFNSSFQYFNQGVISASRVWDKNEPVFVGELECSKLIDWFNAHHIDYRGLIEKGFAIDATDKNIYNYYKIIG